MARPPRGSGTIFKLGGGTRAPPLENYLPPNSKFCSDFGHFILKMHMPSKKNFLNILSAFSAFFGGGRRPSAVVGRIVVVEGRLPPLPPVPGPMRPPVSAGSAADNLLSLPASAADNLLSLPARQLTSVPLARPPVSAGLGS